MKGTGLKLSRKCVKCYVECRVYCQFIYLTKEIKTICEKKNEPCKKRWNKKQHSTLFGKHKYTQTSFVKKQGEYCIQEVSRFNSKSLTTSSTFLNIRGKNMQNKCCFECEKDTCFEARHKLQMSKRKVFKKYSDPEE